MNKTKIPIEEAAKIIAHADKGWDTDILMVKQVESADLWHVGNTKTGETYAVTGLALENFNWPKEGDLRQNDYNLTEVFIGGRWKLYNKDLPYGGDPTPEIKETQEIDEFQLRRAFHANVVAPDIGVVRMVGYAPKLDENDYDSSTSKMKLWFPEEEYDPKAPEYNLVFSLGSNGRHYPIHDLDVEDRPGPAWGSVLIPSTHHWHRYHAISCEWNDLLAGLDLIDNPKYKEMVVKTGFNAARPPWIEKKKGGEPALKRFIDDYKDIEPWLFKDTPPPENEYAGWDALWDDE